MAAFAKQKSWRKEAAQVVDNEAMEKAFMDQAYGLVANRAGELFKDPYRLGFEIVWKNDESTRMVGIFAFRIGQKLLYVPCFFLQGEIKGYDLLYRQWVKMFCPNTAEWVKFLTSAEQGSPGNGVDKGEWQKAPQQVNLMAVASPPGHFDGGKSASVHAGWESFMDEMAAGADAPEPLLGRFIREDGGVPALEKLAALIEASTSFAEALYETQDESEYAPELPPAQPKQAAEKDPYGDAELLLVGGALPVWHKSAAAREHMLKHGYEILDARPPRAKVEITEDPDAVATGVPAPGVCEMLMNDGEFRRVLVGCDMGDDDLFSSGDGLPGNLVSALGSESQPPVVLVELGGKRHSRTWYPGDSAPLVRELAKDVFEDGDPEGLKKKPAAGKAWRVFMKGSGKLSRPFMCSSVRSEKDGVSVIECKLWRDTKDPLKLYLNPDLDSSDPGAGVLGRDALFVEVAHESDEQGWTFPKGNVSPASERTIDNFLTAVGAKKVKVKKDPMGFKMSAASPGSGEFLWRDSDMERVVAHEKLARVVGLDAQLAAEVLDEAAESGREISFTAWPHPSEKAAYATRLVEEPDWESNVGFDGDLGIEVDSPYVRVLDTKTPQTVPEPARLGDKYDPSFGAGEDINSGLSDDAAGMEGSVFKDAPESLAQLAKMREIPSIFNHGVVGELVKTFDAAGMIDKYIPDLEGGLDKMGRILFLFYWKPKDFEKAYGSDDMQKQESDLLNGFRILGDVVLELLQKSRHFKQNQGSAPL